MNGFLFAVLIAANPWVCSDKLFVQGVMTCESDDQVMVLPPGAFVPEGWPQEKRPNSYLRDYSGCHRDETSSAVICDQKRERP